MRHQDPDEDPSIRSLRVSGWADRYEGGDRVGVWTEMISLGHELGQEDRHEASIVAQQTMRRARRNVERLVELLPGIGYVFDTNDDLPVFEPPSTDIKEQLDNLESVVGALPISLRCWYEEVGRVNLVGDHPDWSFEYHDPLVVDAPVDFVLSEFESWRNDVGTERDQGAFTIDVSPDDLHKANVSGGPPYALAVPNSAADGLLLWERHQTTFVNYLRIALPDGRVSWLGPRAAGRLGEALGARSGSLAGGGGRAHPDLRMTGMCRCCPVGHGHDLSSIDPGAGY